MEYAYLCNRVILRSETCLCSTRIDPVLRGLVVELRLQRQYPNSDAALHAMDAGAATDARKVLDAAAAAAGGK